MFHRKPPTPPIFLNNLLFLSGKSIIMRGQMHDFGNPVQKDYDNAVAVSTICIFLSHCETCIFDLLRNLRHLWKRGGFYSGTTVYV